VQEMRRDIEMKDSSTEKFSIITAGMLFGLFIIYESSRNGDNNLKKGGKVR